MGGWNRTPRRYRLICNNSLNVILLFDKTFKLSIICFILILELFGGYIFSKSFVYEIY